MPRLGRIALIGAMSVTGALWLAAAARIVGLERSQGWWCAAQTFTFWMYLPAYAVTGGAAVLRRWLLTASTVPLVMLHLVWVWGDLPWAGLGQPAARGPTFVVAAVNALASNPRNAALADRLARLDADVLVVTELRPALAEVLDRRLTRLPHRAVNAAPGAFGAGIYSRFPLAFTAVRVVGERRTPLVRVVVGGREVTILAVHITPPHSSLDRFEAGLADLATRARIAPPPLVLAGDFNATRQHRAFRRLLAGSGLRDAHHALGRGLARTWPAGRAYPPVALLDHVVVDRNIRVVDIDEFAAPGSDHRGVRARLRLVAP